MIDHREIESDNTDDRQINRWLTNIDSWLIQIRYIDLGIQLVYDW